MTVSNLRFPVAVLGVLFALSGADHSAQGQTKGDTVIATQRIRLHLRGKFVTSVMAGERMTVLSIVGGRATVSAGGKRGETDAHLLQVDRYGTERNRLAKKYNQLRIEINLQRLAKKPYSRQETDRVRWSDRLLGLYSREVSENRKLLHDADDTAIAAKKKYDEYRQEFYRKQDILNRDVSDHNIEIEYEKRKIASLARDFKSYGTAVKKQNALIRGNDNLISSHNRKKNDAKTNAQRDVYNREAKRLNREQIRLLRASGDLRSRLGRLNVQQAKRDAGHDRLNQQKARLDRRTDDLSDTDRKTLSRYRQESNFAKRNRGLAENELVYVYAGWASTWRRTGDFKRSVADSLSLKRIRSDAAIGYYLLGRNRLDQRHSHLAVQEYNRALALLPNDGRILFQRGRAWAYWGQHKRAINDYSNVIRLNPNDSAAHFNRSLLWQRLEKSSLALADIERAITLDPSDHAAFYQRAKIRRKRRELDLAVKDLNQSLRLRLNLSSLLARAEIRSLQLKHEDAVKDFTAAIKLAPHSAQAFAGRGRAYQAMGSLKKSKEDLQQAARLNPIRAVAVKKTDATVTDPKRKPEDSNEQPKIPSGLSTAEIIELACKWVYEKKYNAVIAACDQAIGKDAEQAVAYSLRGLARVASGEKKSDPLADFDTARRRDPKFHQSHLHLGFGLGITGDLDAAFSEFEIALAKDPKLVSQLRKMGIQWILANPSHPLGYFVVGACNEIGTGFSSPIPLYQEAFRLQPDPSLQIRLARAWQKSRPKQALVEITDVIALRPKDAEAYQLRARIQLQLKQYAKAIADASQAIKIDSELSAAFVVRAKSRIERKKLAAAKMDCDQAIKLDSANSDAYLARGKVLTAQGRTTAAIADLTEAIRYKPKSVDCLLARGRAYRKLRRLDEAIRDFTAAMRFRYSFPPALLERGLAYQAKGDLDRATSDLRRAANRDSKLVEAQRQLAWLYATAADGRWRNGSEAVRYARKACELTDYKDPQCLDAMAAARAEVGAFEPAAKMQERAIRMHRSSKLRYAADARLKKYKNSQRFREAMEAFPVPADLRGKSSYRLLSIGKDLRRKKQYKKAIAALTESIRRNPKSSSAYFQRALASSDNRKKTHAIGDYTVAIRLDPTNHRSFYNRAILLYESGQTKWAIRDYDMAIQLDPKHYRSFHGRGYTWNGMGLFSRAKQDYEASIKLNGNYLKSRLAMAELLATCPESNIRDGRQAIVHARRACELSSWKDTNSLGLLANAYATAGRFEDAVKWQKKAIELYKSKYNYSLKARLKLYESKKSYFRQMPIRIDGQSTYAYQSLASKYRGQKRYRKALDAYDRLIEAVPKSAAYYITLRARIRKVQGHSETALAEYARAIRRDSKRPEAYLERAAIYSEKKNYQAAIAEFTALLKLQPTHYYALRDRATAYSLSGNHQKALDEIGSLIGKRKTGAYYLHYLRAQMYKRQGDFEKAIADYKQAVRLSPSSTTSLNGLAWSLSTCSQEQLRDGKQAIEHAAQACNSGYWRNPGRIDTLAAAFAAAGHFSKAVYWQRRAIHLAQTTNGSLTMDSAQRRLKLYLAKKHYTE